MNIFSKRTTDHPETPAEPFVLPDRVADLEQDIREVLEFAPPTHRTPQPALPTYVEHDAEVGEIGKAAAASVITEYEETARQIEAMGEELTKTALRGAEILTEMAKCIEYIKDTATKYREQGKHVFDEIEAKSLLAQNARRICEDLRSQIGERK